MKLFRPLIVLMVAVGLTLGCGDPKGGPAGSGTAGTEPAKKLTVGIVFDKGGRGDQSFNDSAARGLDRAKAELGIEVFERSSAMDKDYETNLASLAQKECDLIIGVGINMEPAVNKVAKEHPHVKFALVDGSSQADNLRALVFTEEQGSFLAGYLAGLMTKSGKVGFVGGMEIPLIKKFHAGYVAGVKTANPEAEVLPAKYTGSWDDTGLGKETARALYAAGADIVYHAAGRCGLGVFDAARGAGEGKYAIGVDSDQDHIAKGRILTSMVKRVDEAVFQTIKDVQNGRFSGGQKLYDLKANGVGLSEMRFTKELIGDEKLKKIEEIRAKIVAEELTVPTDEASLSAYLGTLGK